MSQANIAIVERALAVGANENWAEVPDLFAPDAEIHDFDIPDADVYRGPDGFIEWLEQWGSAWDSWEMSDIDVRTAADQRVVVLVTMTVKGQGSGVELQRRDAMLYTLRDGKISRIEYYNERQKGPVLAAAGVSE